MRKFLKTALAAALMISAVTALCSCTSTSLSELSEEETPTQTQEETYAPQTSSTQAPATEEETEEVIITEAPTEETQRSSMDPLTEEEISEKLEEIGEFEYGWGDPFIYQSMSVVKRQTNLDDKTDYVYVAIEGENDEIHCTSGYYLEFVLYNDGWELDDYYRTDLGVEDSYPIALPELGEMMEDINFSFYDGYIYDDDEDTADDPYIVLYDEFEYTNGDLSSISSDEDVLNLTQDSSSLSADLADEFLRNQKIVLHATLYAFHELREDIISIRAEYTYEAESGLWIGGDFVNEGSTYKWLNLPGYWESAGNVTFPYEIYIASSNYTDLEIEIWSTYDDDVVYDGTICANDYDGDIFIDIEEPDGIMKVLSLTKDDVFYGHDSSISYRCEKISS